MEMYKDPLCQTMTYFFSVDATMLQYVNEWAQPLNALQDEVVGYSKLTIDGTRQNCRVRECLMGNFLF